MNFKINAYVEPHYPIKKSLLVSSAESSLEAAEVKGRTEVSVSIIGDRKMRQLNKEYRGVDAPTDVLSFPFLETNKSKDFPTPPSKYLNLGDVLISYPQLLEKAAKENVLVDDMARVLVIHGVLHLLGYDHAQPEDAEKMEHLEDQILEKLGTKVQEERGA